MVRQKNGAITLALTFTILRKMLHGRKFTLLINPKLLMPFLDEKLGHSAHWKSGAALGHNVFGF